jgi:hypothetical protein
VKLQKDKKTFVKGEKTNLKKCIGDRANRMARAPRLIEPAPKFSLDFTKPRQNMMNLDIMDPISRNKPKRRGAHGLNFNSSSLPMFSSKTSVASMTVPSHILHQENQLTELSSHSDLHKR